MHFVTCVFTHSVRVTNLEAKTILTTHIILTLKPGRQRYEKSEPGGLRVCVWPSGRKTLCWRYRDPGGAQRVFMLGEWPHMSLTEARRRLAEAKALRETGTDPAEQAAAKRETRRDIFRAKGTAPTVGDILEEYMTRHVTQHCRPATVAEFARLIEMNIKPACGRLQAHEATRSGIVAVPDRIADHAGRVLGQAFNFAVKRGRLEASPCQALPAYARDKPRERTLTAAEIHGLWQALDAHKGLSEPVALALKLLLTGQRRGSPAVAEWSEFEGDRWTLPAGHTKMGTAHIVPLSGLAQKIVERLRELTGMTQWVLPNPSLHGPITARALTRALTRLRSSDYTVHDLRRTAATFMGEAGVNRFVIARVLRHVDAGMTGIYDRHAYAPEKRRALETLARKVGGIVGRSETATVVVLR